MPQVDAVTGEPASRTEPTSWWPIAALAAVVVVVSWPACSGGWVYDDWKMRGNDTMDGVEDLAAAFGRTSADYFHTGPDKQLAGVTYRPLSMVTLIAVMAFSQDAPLPHHLVSLVLHLACVLLLWRTLRARAGPWLALALVTVFALHPLAIEAYGWINGRSDVLAGVGLALVALALWSPSGNRWSWALAFAGGAIAVLAKETGAFAVLGLVASDALPERGLPDREHLRARAPKLAAGFAGVAAAIALRAVAVGLESSGASTLALERDPVGGVAHLWAEALGSALLPWPRTMATLAWELAAPWSAIDVGLLLVGAAAIVALIVGRRGRALVLVSSALVMIVPALVVRHSFWQGFDRYLYMPAMLVCLAISAATLPSLERRLSSRARWIALTALGLVLSWSSFATARTYAGQAEHMTALIEMRPDDPTGSLVGARFLWHAEQHDQALRLLERVPRRGLPPAMASELATLLGEVGLTEEALGVVDDMARRFPDDPWVLYDLVSVRLSQHQHARAFAAARRIAHLPSFCRGTHEIVRVAEGREDREGRRTLRAWRRDNRCR